MKEYVVKLLKEQLWYLGTYSNEPNAVPVAFKDVTNDGKLIVGDVFLETTLSNIKANGKVAVSACNGATMEGYQIKGTAEYVTEGPIVDTFKNSIRYVQGGCNGQGRSHYHSGEGHRYHPWCRQ
ncbi:MAG: pyridoxamine 5'-phosphate oxidase family protein [Syntrophomonas sp.]